MRHNVYISYHHYNDKEYRKKFEKLFDDYYNVFITRSVQIGEIDANLKADTIRQKIRDDYLRDSTVTIVLIGAETWKRKHVDWEISSSIRKTGYNSRSGVLGIILPTYPLNLNNKFDPYTLPPRLYLNWKCGYAQLYRWSDNPDDIYEWINNAFKSRNNVIPDNSYPSYIDNKNGVNWK